MSQTTVWWRAFVISAVALALIFSMGAAAEQAKTQGAMATVDLGKIQTDYHEKQVAESDLQIKKKQYDEALERRQLMLFLTPEDHKKLDELLAKGPAQRTKAENDAIEEIKKRGNDLNEEMRALEQKPQDKLTETDKARIKQGQDMLTKGQQALATYKDAAENDLKQMVTSKSEKIVKDVREAIKKVAEKKALSIVFNSEVAPYAGVDITSDVLSDLNKK